MDINFIRNLLDSNLTIGKRIDIYDDLFIFPLYKSKITFLNIESDVKDVNNDGSSGSLNINPIGLIKVNGRNIDIIHLDLEKNKDGIIDIIPGLLQNIDLNSVLKNIKL